jgi:hypothetical protein
MLIFRHDVGFRIKGNRSREKLNKSIGLYWRENYGKDKLKYKIFPDLDVSTFK